MGVKAVSPDKAQHVHGQIDACRNSHFARVQDQPFGSLLRLRSRKVGVGMRGWVLGCLDEKNCLDGCSIHRGAEPRGAGFGRSRSDRGRLHGRGSWVERIGIR